MSRTIALGDIHGCSDALRSILRAIDPQSEDTIIALGDYVDRGSDSRGVLDILLELSARCYLVPILGNHEEMMLWSRDSGAECRRWLQCGGNATLESYGSPGNILLVSDEHFRFLESCVSWFETETHFFVHANYDPDLSLDHQENQVLRWLSLHDSVPGPHSSGKIAVVGHTPQSAILDLGHIICLDTGCVYGGQLTAMELKTGKIWQSTKI